LPSSKLSFLIRDLDFLSRQSLLQLLQEMLPLLQRLLLFGHLLVQSLQLFLKNSPLLELGFGFEQTALQGLLLPQGQMALRAGIRLGC
jgi:hypothetical protein